jgi:type I restriction enzyme S subunit
MSKLLEEISSAPRISIKLADAASRIGDGLHGTPIYDNQGEYYFINGNNLDNGYILIKKDTRKINYSEYLKHKKDLSERSLLLSINGTIGNLARYRGEKCILGKSAAYINIKNDFQLDYFYYVLSDNRFKKHITNNASGSTIKNVSLEQLREYEVSVPDLSTQKKIAEILSAYDSKIENNNLIIKNLEITAQTIFKEWFVDFRFPGHKGTSFVESEMGDIPVGWRIKKISDVAVLNKGVSYTSKELNSEGYGVALINLGNFRRSGGFNPDGTKYYTGEYKQTHSVSPGQILIAMTDLTSNREVIGHPARLPSNFKKAVISLDVCSLKPKENIYTEFLYYLMLSRNFSKLMASCASGTNVSHLSKSYIEGYDFIFPNNALLVQFNNFIQPMIMRQVTLNEESLALKQSRDQLLTEMI